eukprot:4403398-Pyramimonas_sp.AAC.1
MPRLPHPATLERIETALRTPPCAPPLVSRECHACHAPRPCEGWRPRSWTIGAYRDRGEGILWLYLYLGPRNRVCVCVR